jgi:outer membrane protein OmpA-like peptidoglycan-associated protein
MLLKMVRPDATYTRFLRATPGNGIQNLNVEDQREYGELKDEYDRHKQELLPDGLTNLEELEAKTDAAWIIYQAHPEDTLAKERWSLYQQNLKLIEDWASYTRLHQRVARGFKSIRSLGLLLLAALAVFAWCANPKHDKEESLGAGKLVIEQTSIGSVPPPPTVPPPIRLTSVVFELGKSRLTAEGLQAVGHARDYLRNAPESAVLLFAHTDTTGGDGVNATLAAERARVVRKTLSGEGGIAPARIFIASLPGTDLATITGPKVPLERNRTVEFAIVTMPLR